MKIRIRFSKTGPIRFAGHLDFQRTFQKAVKKSGLPAVYTSGFNPHMLMSFAAPLGVGEETTGDYADIEFAFRDPFPMSEHDAYRLKDIGLDNETLPPPPPADVFTEILNSAMPEGVRTDGAVRIGQTRNSKAMALVRYASWLLVPGDRFLSSLTGPAFAEMLSRFSAEEKIIICKKTKKAEKETDIRPMIRELGTEAGPLPTFIGDSGFTPGRSVILTCSCGSTENLKPAAAMEAFCSYAGLPYDPYGFRTIRTETFDADMRPLLALGSGF